MAVYEFDEATSLTPQPDGVFAVDFTDQWSGLAATLNGGFMLASCLKALDHVLPFPDPIAVSAFYLRPGVPGPAVIRTEPIRGGRTTAFGAAQLLQGGKEVLRLTAAFADLFAVTPQYTGATPPKLPDPDDCERLGGIAGITMAQRFSFRAPAFPGWTRGKPSGDPSTEFWMRFADGRPADTLTLPFIVDACPPAVLELGARGSTTIELTVHIRARPAPGWLACRVSTRHVSGGYHEEDFEAWDCAGVLVAQSRQLALVRPR
jgi:acyl-CoA thioesterase